MKLLIPGPVTTQAAVREAAAQDYAPWDNEFRPIYAGIRARVLRIAGTDDTVHATVPLQGCGHFMMEAAARTFVPAGGRVLIPHTGAYADRAIRLARAIGVDVRTMVPENERVDPEPVFARWRPTRVSATSPPCTARPSDGIIHDVPGIAAGGGRAGPARVIVDAVSALGAHAASTWAALPMRGHACRSRRTNAWRGWPGMSFTVAPDPPARGLCQGQARELVVGPGASC